MPGFNGAGVFVRTYDWTDDKAAGIKVRADRMDTEMDGFATGLSTCITKDGQTTITANIPFNSNKITGLAAGSSAGDSVRYEQVALLSAGANQTITRSVAGTVLTLESTDADAASGPDLSLYRNSATPAASDVLGSILFDGEDSAGNQQTYASIRSLISDTTSGSEDADLRIRLVIAGTLADEVILTGTAFSPASSDGNALGTSSLMWGDLFLASGAVVNFNNGDVTITHSANTLAFAGASSGYTHDAAVLPSSNDAAALGASGTAWADLFLASGGVVNFNAGNYTLTHSAGLLTASGAITITSGALTVSAGTIAITNSSAGSILTLESTDAGASHGPSITLYRNSATPAVSDNIGSILFTGEDSAGNTETYAQITGLIGDPTSTSEDAQLYFGVVTAGTFAYEMILLGNTLTPVTSDGLALGTSALMWSDLFLASGAVVNFNNGDVTVTHSANTLAFAGASSGYTFDAAPLPSSNDGAALGASGTAWSDLFLASGAVINFNASNVTITHGAGTLTASGVNSFTIESTDDGATAAPSLILYRNSATPAAADVIGQLLFDFEDSASNQTTGAGIAGQINDPTNGSEDVALLFLTVTAGVLATELVLTGTALYPGANDGSSLGISGTAFSDLYLASGGAINFNAGDVTITHAANSLTIAGATSVAIDATVYPATDATFNLGDPSFQWNDFYLDGSIVFDNDVTILKSGPNAITLAGGTFAESAVDAFLDTLGTETKGALLWHDGTSWVVLAPP